MVWWIVKKSNTTQDCWKGMFQSNEKQLVPPGGDSKEKGD